MSKYERLMAGIIAEDRQLAQLRDLQRLLNIFGAGGWKISWTIDRTLPRAA